MEDTTLRLVSEINPVEGDVSETEEFTESILDLILDNTTTTTATSAPLGDSSAIPKLSTTTDSNEENFGGEVVIEAGDGDVDEEELGLTSSEGVETIHYKMTTNARLGQLEIHLDHLSDGRVRLSLTMEEEVAEDLEAAAHSETPGFGGDETTLSETVPLA